MEIYLNEINQILSKLFQNYQKTVKNPGILLSGGIDSSTIAYLLNNSFTDYTILSMGTKAGKDKPFVEIMSKYIGKKPEWVEIRQEDIKENINTVREILAKSGLEANLMQISLAMGYFLIFKKANNLKIKYIFTGQGPDILFAGYNMYKGVKDLNEKIKNDLPLLEIDKKRDSAMADYFDITLINPYLEKEFVSLSLEIPGKFKIHEGVQKYILREFGKKVGLPTEIINRPKKAFQYSTGLQSLIKKYFNFIGSP